MRKFGLWRPDLDGSDTDQVLDALNVLPQPDGYGPWPGLATTSEALEAVARGACIARASDGSIVIFVGTEDALWKFAATGDPWTDVSRLAGGAYAVPTGERWKFRQYGPRLHAWNGADEPQVITIDGGTNFADTGGSPPVARTGAVIGGHVMLGDLSTGRRMVHWSGLENDAYWTPGRKRCDFQEFPDGGIVRGITGYELGGVVLQADTVRRVVSRSDTAVFEFYRIDDAQGTSSPDSIVSYKALTFYYGVDGFAVVGTDGSSEDIGVGMVDDWFKEDCHQSRLATICGARDPTRPRIFWLYPSSQNASSLILDRCICYDIKLKAWSHAELSASVIFTAASPGYTLEGLDAEFADLDAMEVSLDSPVWQGGVPALGAFDSNFKLALSAGSNLAATVQSAKFQPIPRRRFYVNGFTLDIDTPAATGRVGVADRKQDALAFGASQSLTAQGLIPAHSSGSYMVVEASVPAGTNWDRVRGFDFPDGELVDDGEM